MSEVRIIQMRHACRVVCTCGLDRYMTLAPERCPACGLAWDRPLIEEVSAVPSAFSRTALFFPPYA